MDISSLFTKSITRPSVLTEAEGDSKYGIPDEIFRGEDPPPQENDDTSNDQYNNDYDNNIDDNEDPLDNENNEDENDDYDDGRDLNNDDQEEDGAGDDEDGSDFVEPEDDDSKINNEENQQDNINSIPKLEVLNLSPRDRKLCNIELIGKFNTLANEARDNLNNNIITMTTISRREAQIVKMVSDNIIEMIKAIEDYVLYKYDDIYEENVMTYHLFCKQYRDALSLIEEVVKTQSARVTDDKTNSRRKVVTN